MSEAPTTVRGGEHWMALEGGREGSPPRTRYSSRFAAIGARAGITIVAAIYRA